MDGVVAMADNTLPFIKVTAAALAPAAPTHARTTCGCGLRVVDATAGGFHTTKKSKKQSREKKKRKRKREKRKNEK
ncbi:hypothetical protein [Corynebacterium sp. 13CS0277]|uniref:hypothetical protein n=1 Tax=Corynebacterium sp. 13CS0277 TaxID=2071994 RepID=UPI0011B219A7|nr:hypothetical protein [Corynebacterium sp. 13CS0277]